MSFGCIARLLILPLCARTKTLKMFRPSRLLIYDYVHRANISSSHGCPSCLLGSVRARFRWVLWGRWGLVRVGCYNGFDSQLGCRCN